MNRVLLRQFTEAISSTEAVPSGSGRRYCSARSRSVRSLKAAAQLPWFSVRSLTAAAQLPWFSVRSLTAAARLCLHSDTALEPGPLGSGPSRGIRHSRSVRSLKAAAQQFWFSVRSLKAAAQVREAPIEKHSSFDGTVRTTARAESPRPGWLDRCPTPRTQDRSRRVHTSA